MPDPTPEELAQAEKRRRAAGKTATGLATLVIPEVPFHPMPATVAQRNPELDAWNRENFTVWKRWREQVNAVFVRLPQPP